MAFGANLEAFIMLEVEKGYILKSFSFRAMPLKLEQWL